MRGATRLCTSAGGTKRSTGGAPESVAARENAAAPKRGAVCRFPRSPCPRDVFFVRCFDRDLAFPRPRCDFSFSALLAFPRSASLRVPAAKASRYGLLPERLFFTPGPPAQPRSRPPPALCVSFPAPPSLERPLGLSARPLPSTSTRTLASFASSTFPTFFLSLSLPQHAHAHRLTAPCSPADCILPRFLLPSVFPAFSLVDLSADDLRRHERDAPDEAGTRAGRGRRGGTQARRANSGKPEKARRRRKGSQAGKRAKAHAGRKTARGERNAETRTESKETEEVR